MNQKINELTTLTIEEFQDDFDNYMTKVEDGESFIISSEHGNAIIVPYNEVVQTFQKFGSSDELIRIHTDHEEGS